MDDTGLQQPLMPSAGTTCPASCPPIGTLVPAFSAQLAARPLCAYTLRPVNGYVSAEGKPAYRTITGNDLAFY